MDTPPTGSDDGEIPRFGVADGVDGNGLIQGHESAVVGGRERQQVGVGHLAVPEQPGMIDQLFIEPTGHESPGFLVTESVNQCVGHRRPPVLERREAVGIRSPPRVRGTLLLGECLAGKLGEDFAGGAVLPPSAFIHREQHVIVDR